VIVIITFNVEGITRNRAFLQELFSSEPAIVCFQEHWLRSFEELLAIECCEGRQIHSTYRDSDEDSDTIYTRFRSDRGGILTTWDPSLNKHAKKKVQDSSERILVTCFDTPTKICIVNCYLSSGPSKQAYELYAEDIDRIEEIITKYDQSHEVIILGDLNTDHFHRNGDKEKRLKRLISEHKLLDLGTNNSSIMTYNNLSLQHHSRIDHILVKTTSADRYTETVPCHNESMANVSHHTALSARCRISHNKPKRQKESHTPTMRFKWKEADTTGFKNELEHCLTLTNLDHTACEHKVNILKQSLNTAAIASIPYLKSRPRKSPITKAKLTPEIKAAVTASGIAHAIWKAEGRPIGSASQEARKAARKKVRSVQRIHAATARYQLLNRISTADCSDQQLQHALIKRQRATGNFSYQLLIDDVLVDDPSIQREGFADYYEKLSSPKYPDRVQYLLTTMRTLADANKEDIIISRDILCTAIRRLNANKAADQEGLTAEHLKLLLHSESGTQLLTELMQEIFTTGNIPDSANSNTYKLPIPKKSLDTTHMGNHRGITIPPILVKLIEAVIKIVEADTLNEDQHGLQFGFTKGLSPVMATLVLTEALAHAYTTKQSLFICSLDARKAFDVVAHALLKFKLFQTGINRATWSIIDKLYTGSKECIKWKGGYSRTYSVNQGVKQGGLGSTDYYKAYCNNLPHMLEKSGLGLHIGNIYLGSPICADDNALLTTNPFELQAMMTLCHDHSKKQYYDLHETKSVCITMLTSKDDYDTYFTWALGENPATQKEEIEHLGQIWEAGNLSPDIGRKISSARKTSYSMIGVGVHGSNGLDPVASYHITHTYIFKRLTYGLEAIVLNKVDFNRLDSFYHNQLRIIQAFSKNTSRVAVYIMLGALPFTALYHHLTLILFGNISRMIPSNNLYRLAKRQLLQDSPRSWFVQVKEIGHKYNIDCCKQILKPVSHGSWKALVSRSILTHHQEAMHEEAKTRHTLRWVLWSPFWYGKPHPTWSCCKGDVYSVSGACIRMKMLTGRYPLNKDRYEYKTSKTPNCPLCEQEPEDITHFLTGCKVSQPIHDEKITKLQHIYTQQGLTPPITDHELTSAILNGWGYASQEGSAASVSLADCEGVHRLCSRICYKMDKFRQKLVDEKAKSSVTAAAVAEPQRDIATLNF
jgi:exonuclease III